MVWFSTQCKVIVLIHISVCIHPTLPTQFVEEAVASPGIDFEFIWVDVCFVPLTVFLIVTALQCALKFDVVMLLALPLLFKIIFSYSGSIVFSWDFSDHFF